MDDHTGSLGFVLAFVDNIQYSYRSECALSKPQVVIILLPSVPVIMIVFTVPTSVDSSNKSTDVAELFNSCQSLEISSMFKRR